MKRSIALFLVLTLCFAALAGCSSKKNAADDLEYVKKNGEMIIGITDYEPMNYYAADGTIIGFDTELAQAVCDKLGITAKFVEIDWDNKEIELDSYKIDCIWNGFTYTAARDENLDFTKNYLYNGIVIVVRTDDLGKYASVSDLADAKIAAEGGSTAEEAILADAVLSKADYTAVDSLVSSLLEVSAKTADAAVVDSTMAHYLVGKGAYEGLSIIDGVVLSEEELSIGLRTGSSLVAAINEALDTLTADGTVAQIAEKYGLTDVVMLGK